jgi:hypothetical protein
MGSLGRRYVKSSASIGVGARYSLDAELTTSHSDEPI